jgi:hypothetical protein
MKNEKRLNGPVVIGGVGGSGTRVVAEIVQHAGFYLGHFLNPPQDNLWFTFLFKRPQWFAHLLQQQAFAELMQHLQLFEHIMTGQFKERPQTLLQLFFAAKDYIAWQAHYKAQLGIQLPPENPADFVKSVVFAPPVDFNAYRGWGWKEPNSHLFLAHLCAYFPNLRYIHLVRHGLDMAYSENQQQYFNWGPLLFDIPWQSDPQQRPVGSLAYWLHSNQATIETAQQQLGNRFLLLHFEQLCLNPKAELSRLLQFLAVSYTEEELTQLAQLPQLPNSYQRFKQQDLSIFSAQQLAAVEALGYAVS